MSILPALSMSEAAKLILIVIVCAIFGYLATRAQGKKRNRRKYRECAAPSAAVMRAWFRYGRNEP